MNSINVYVFVYELVVVFVVSEDVVSYEVSVYFEEGRVGYVIGVGGF